MMDLVFIVAFIGSPFELWDLRSLTLLRTMPKKFPPITALDWSPLHNLKHLKRREREKLERGEMLEPILDSEELHRTKVKQLMDLEEALRVDKKKMMLLVGSSLILMILQVGTFVFL